MAQPTPEYVQRRRVSQLSKIDSMAGSNKWRDLAVFHVRGLLLSFSAFRFLTVRRIKSAYFKIKLLSDVSRYLMKRRGSRYSRNVEFKLRRFKKNSRKSISDRVAGDVGFDFLIKILSQSPEPVISYDVPRLSSYDLFWKWLLVTQGVEIKRLGYLKSVVANLENSTYRRLLRYNKRNKKKTINPRKKKLQKFTKFKESNYFFLKTKRFLRNRHRLAKRDSLSSMRIVRLRGQTVVSYCLKFK